MQQLPTVSAKKPYQSPQLRVYGDIRELTLTNSQKAGTQDNPKSALKT